MYISPAHARANRMNSEAVETRNYCLLTTNIKFEHFLCTGGLTKCKISFISVMEKYGGPIN